MSTNSRREFLTQMAALKGGLLALAPVNETLVGVVALETSRHGLLAALERSGITQPEEWLSVAAEYTRDFYTAPSADLFHQLTKDTLVLQSLIREERKDSHLAVLRSAAAQLSVVGAMCLSSLGDVRGARRWWSTARKASDLAGLTEIRIWTRDWEAVNGLYERRPVGEVLSIIAEALEIGGNVPCSGTAGILAGRAQALAISGQRAEAVKTLAVLADMSAELPVNTQNDALSMFGWPEYRLRYTESYVYTQLGNNRGAFAAQDQALKLYPPQLVKERAQMEFHRAHCLIKDGHITEGISHANDILNTLPTIHHNELLYELGRALFAAIPTSERSRSAAAEFRARLALPTTTQLR